MADTRNAAYNRAYNRREIIKALRRAPSSRADLSRRLGLTRAAVTNLIDGLITEGAVEELMCGDSGAVGRPSTLLTVSPNAAYTVGIFFNRTGLRIGLSDFCGHLLCVTEPAVCPGACNGEVLDLMAESVKEVVLEAGVPRERVTGIGLCTPGPVNAAEGLILNPPHFEQWNNYPVAAELEKRTGLKVYLENDANALAMHFAGRAFGEDSTFLLLIVDEGIGSGLIEKGCLYHRRNGFTPELGHISVKVNGRKCGCGNRGCLEMYASLNVLKRKYGFERLEDAPAAALKEEAELLACGLLNLHHLIPLDGVILYGPLAEIRQEIGPRTEAILKKQSLGKQPVPLQFAAPQNETCIQAAAEIVINSELKISR